MAKFFISTGASFAALGILLGAFGAHGLKNRLETRMLEIWHTGVNYHMYHALGLIFIGILLHQLGDSSFIKWSGRLMITGIILFSGSLYLLAFTGIRWLGAITPLGGISFIIAWLLLSFALLRANY
ncbi:DUF423 domain-containing protein [Candidatus Nitrosacidococcus tergens]|uniref:DUF423 domain-containing protein n=1 Tax=Candidatus Nitrosacidococcus tergens TaxID=553981 RepID=A0A7G1Q940_9GAMM|nr:DUF423 domain-containing protein [Candidatus Nitrosacidococcus tergens]CAB1275465.1 conserved membrane protein of unknown function [Candidatus Nitrosacidococcus tergens]